jgi:uncharacterized protein YjbI with pentapeptide repeats
MLIGDRTYKGGLLGGVTDPKPFTEMDLTWERSFGGPGVDANPLGRGVKGASRDALVMLPNIENPAAMIRSPSDRPTPAGAFPIPPGWPNRRALAGTFDEAWRAQYWPLFPRDLDEAYFLAAPADQRIEGFFRGDEEIEIVDFHPEERSIKCRLPGVRPRVLLARKGAAAPEEVRLELDTIGLDGDELRAFAVWRGRVDGVTEALAVSLERAKLDEAVLEGADLSQAKFVGTSLKGVVLTKARAAGATFDGACLDDVSAEGADFEGARFVKTTFWRADLVGVKLRGATFEDAVLDGADMIDAVLEGATFTRSKLVDASIERAKARGIKFVGCELEKLRASEGADLREAVFTQAPAKGARFGASLLDKAVFTGACLDGADFSGASLLEAVLDRASVKKARFDGAKLAGARLVASDFYEAKFEGADLSRADLRAASLFRAEFLGAKLDGAKLDGADLTGTKKEP